MPGWPSACAPRENGSSDESWPERALPQVRQAYVLAVERVQAEREVAKQPSGAQVERRYPSSWRSCSPVGASGGCRPRTSPPRDRVRWLVRSSRREALTSSRLPLGVAGLALAVAVWGATPLGDAATDLGRRLLLADNSKAVNGIKASRTPRPNQLLALDRTGKSRSRSCAAASLVPPVRRASEALREPWAPRGRPLFPVRPAPRVRAAPQAPLDRAVLRGRPV